MAKPRAVLAVFDSGPDAGADRYTVVLRRVGWGLPPGEYPMLGMSDDPEYGVSQFSSGHYPGRHLGKRVPWEHLPLNVQSHATRRLGESDNPRNPAVEGGPYGQGVPAGFPDPAHVTLNPGGSDGFMAFRVVGWRSGIRPRTEIILGRSEDEVLTRLRRQFPGWSFAVASSIAANPTRNSYWCEMCGREHRGNTAIGRAHGNPALLQSWIQQQWR